MKLVTVFAVSIFLVNEVKAAKSCFRDPEKCRPGIFFDLPYIWDASVIIVF